MDDKTRVRCNNCGSEFDEERIEHYLETDDPESDYIGHCPVCWGIDVAAISIIGPEAIRAEARTEYRVELDAYIRTLRNFRDNWDCDDDAHAHGTTCRACEAADVLSHFARAAILADEPKEREAEGPKVCGNCLHGRSTSLDDIRCYKSCPYIATGLHCKACEDWEPCGTSDNPRALIVERKLNELDTRDGLLYKSDVDDRGEG